MLWFLRFGSHDSALLPTDLLIPGHLNDVEEEGDEPVKKNGLISEAQSYMSDLTSSGYNNSNSILESLSEDDSTEMVSIKEMSGTSSMIVQNGPSSSMGGHGTGQGMSHMTPMSPRSITTTSMSASGKSMFTFSVN